MPRLNPQAFCPTELLCHSRGNNVRRLDIEVSQSGVITGDEATLRIYLRPAKVPIIVG